MRLEKIYVSIIGILYILYGIIQVLNGFSSIFSLGELYVMCLKVSDMCIPNIFPDIFSGIGLLTIGILFVYSLYHKEETKSAGYLLVGWILGILLLGLNIVEIVSNIIDAYYPIIFGREPNFDWSLSTDGWGIAPHIILGLFILPLYYKYREQLAELFPKKTDITS